MSDFGILVGRVEGAVDLPRLLEEVGETLGVRLREMPEGSRRFWGELGDHRVYVNDEFDVNGVDEPTEPYQSHPYEIIVDSADDVAGKSIAVRLYEAMKGSGEYQLILLNEGLFLGSTHFPEEEW
ncbi:hypothetical protein AB0B86_26045 [Micromonospora sp. NPDC049047]|uniref:hypothetical protein n=1 Tax=Micromonospora sp. NPDC049047 TaxID=3155645 RepID=UPI0033DEF6A0